jgi:Fe-S oxidoreductase
VLARKLQIINPPRALLKTIFQEQYKDIPYSAGLTHCCGYGGLVNIANSNYAEEMATMRLQEFADAGIKTIVTTCPTCWYSFMKNNEKLEFEIIDLLEIIAQNIKVEQK